jgi:hypothetical protein
VLEPEVEGEDRNWELVEVVEWCLGWKSLVRFVDSFSNSGRWKQYDCLVLCSEGSKIENIYIFPEGQNCQLDL